MAGKHAFKSEKVCFPNFVAMFMLNWGLIHVIFLFLVFMPLFINSMHTAFGYHFVVA